MKLGKKGLLALSFVVGACMFVTTAFADMALRTGYDQLKDSIKHTSNWLASAEESYTLTLLHETRLNNVVIYEDFTEMKIDAAKQVSEGTHRLSGFNRKSYEDHSYQDESMIARKSDRDDHYFVTEFGEGNHNWLSYEDPFQYDGAQDFERIFDALVGNLKDHVIVENRADGGKIFRGSLSEAQVPALVNAVLSFLAKQSYLENVTNDENEEMKLEQDVYVKKITGRAEENSRGLLETLNGEIVIVGIDSQGKQHEIAFQFSYELHNVGSTTVMKPDLTNAEVHRVGESKHEFSQKHIGTYRNDIVVEKSDDEFLKIGERTLEIHRVDSDSISGRYYETIEPEYAEYFLREPLDFEFETEQMRWFTMFPYTGHDGKQYYGEMYPDRQAKVILNLYTQIEDDNFLSYNGEFMEQFDSYFIRVFE